MTDARQLELFSSAELVELAGADPLRAVLAVSRALFDAAPDQAAVARLIHAPLAELVRELEELEAARGLAPILAAGVRVWSARVGADAQFVEGLLTGLSVSWVSGAFDYEDGTAGDAMSGSYGSWLISLHPYVGWSTPDFGLWATGGYGWGGVEIDDDKVADPQSSDLTQWSVAGGGSVTVLSTDRLIAGGTTALKLKGEGLFAHAQVKESKTIASLEVEVQGMGVRRSGSARTRRGRPRPGGERAPGLGRDREWRRWALSPRHDGSARRQQPGGRPRRGSSSRS